MKDGLMAPLNRRNRSRRRRRRSTILYRNNTHALTARCKWFNERVSDS